jgi:hypothetical protein
MTITDPTSIHTQHDDELELPVEVVAERLGLPAAMIIRRIEAGDIPARQVEDVDGSHWHVRLADLGPSAAEEVEDITSDDDEAEHVALAGRPAIATDVAEPDDLDIPPPPARGTVELQPIDDMRESPRAELTMMNLDPRELVAGLLDRWERTLEQRIYAEQRQRFEAELSNRQNKVKQLQLELDAVRAEHAAALAEKERQLAERLVELTERDRELNDMRMRPPRRGWFSRR